MTVTACYRAAGIAYSVAYFNQARNWTRPLDPFALDLDGDGLESTGDMGGTTVLFDHDRYGDNRITSGAELFGVDTPLASGLWDTVTLANSQRTIFRDGFRAIAPLDTNRDGRIDASDGAVAGWSIRRDLNGDGVIGANETRLAQSSDLRIWRDANVNGRVDSGELMSFARADFAPPNASPSATGLPALNGSDAVADLQGSASRRGTLASVVSTYAAQTTRAGKPASHAQPCSRPAIA